MHIFGEQGDQLAGAVPPAPNDALPDLAPAEALTHEEILQEAPPHLAHRADEVISRFIDTAHGQPTMTSLLRLTKAAFKGARLTKAEFGAFSAAVFTDPRTEHLEHEEGVRFRLGQPVGSTNEPMQQKEETDSQSGDITFARQPGHSRYVSQAVEKQLKEIRLSQAVLQVQRDRRKKGKHRRY